ncbi:hypothetical protein VNO77_04453 [Canavalia gladiata]|uniref:Uncharacterized protein n=1 Tax=Canavalia gladiata TaxID=3824 RepID=A0AAN9R7S8_CANGL
MDLRAINTKLDGWMYPPARLWYQPVNPQCVGSPPFISWNNLDSLNINDLSSFRSSFPGPPTNTVSNFVPRTRYTLLSYMIADSFLLVPDQTDPFSRKYSLRWARLHGTMQFAYLYKHACFQQPSSNGYQSDERIEQATPSSSPKQIGEQPDRGYLLDDPVNSLR